MTGTPTFAITMRTDVEIMTRHQNYADGYCYAGDVAYTNMLQALIDGGIQVGSHSYSNANGTAYYYVMLKDGDHFKTGTYVGNGTDNHQITGIGFQPDFVVVNADYHFIKEATTASSDLTTSLRSGIANTAGLIKSLDADGFTLGTYGYVNDNTETEYYLVFEEH